MDVLNNLNLNGKVYIPGGSFFGRISWKTVAAASAGSSIITGFLSALGYTATITWHQGGASGTIKLESPSTAQGRLTTGDAVPTKVKQDWNNAVAADFEDDPTNGGISTDKPLNGE